ncbi:MAG TPA: hypothetical protein VJ508_06385, partial [Saprospiraceae bacterium]|nr:hypothetical protein [Saprospiraceae bacterium]
MDADSNNELIIVRSLTESDLGLFGVHRPSMRAKQRAIQINSSVAKRLVSPEIFENRGGYFDCVCIFGDIRIHEQRHIGKPGKNWRLGGNKIDGALFAKLDCKDFVLIRSVASNDGSHPVTITFACRATDRIVHAGIAAIVEKVIDKSMAVYSEGAPGFADLARYCPTTGTSPLPAKKSINRVKQKSPSLPPMPKYEPTEERGRKRTIHEKVRSPHILEKMLSAAGDLSAPAQFRFMETVEQLASQLRQLLLETGGIIQITKDHAGLWRDVAGQSVGFVDGGLANLSMLGSAPIAARVGGYIVTPGERGESRERFTMLKQLIDELYSHEEGGIYEDTYPDIGALRDAARISIEAAGAVHMVSEQPDISWVLVHGALVNPVSRYTDVMRDGKIRHRF